MAFEIDDNIHKIVLSSSDVVHLLKKTIEREGSQSAFAKHHSIHRTNLNMVLSGKRPVTDAVAKALGLRKAYAVSSPAADGCDTEIAPRAKGKSLIDA
jgi:hypothetical protein